MVSVSIKNMALGALIRGIKETLEDIFNRHMSTVWIESPDCGDDSFAEEIVIGDAIYISEDDAGDACEIGDANGCASTGIVTMNLPGCTQSYCHPSCPCSRYCECQHSRRTPVFEIYHPMCSENGYRDRFKCTCDMISYIKNADNSSQTQIIDDIIRQIQELWIMQDRLNIGRETSICWFVRFGYIVNNYPELSILLSKLDMCMRQMHRVMSSHYIPPGQEECQETHS